MRVMFVHGAFVRDGAWWWAPVARRLAAAGVVSAAALLPSCGETARAPSGAGPGLADDAAALQAQLDDGGPSTVVAHSYGGMVAAEACERPDVVHLVYLSSFLPRVGESLAELAVSDDPVPVAPRPDGSVDVIAGPDFDKRFLQDVTDPELVSGAHDRLTAQSSAVFATPVSAAAWEHRPSTYLVCAQDNSTPVPLQRAHAARAGRQIDLPTGHHPFLSRPDLVAEALLALVERG